MQSFTVTYVPVDQSQSMLSVIVLAPPTTVDIGDLMKDTYYIVTVYANNSVGRSPDSNSVTTRTDIDCKLLCYMSIYYFVCAFCLHYTSSKSLRVSICHTFTFQFINMLGIN